MNKTSINQKKKKEIKPIIHVNYRVTGSVIKSSYISITTILHVDYRVTRSVIKTLLHVDHSDCFCLVASSATHFVSVTNACSVVKNRDYIDTVKN